MLGTKEIVIIAAVIVLLFGAKKIPELAKAIGEAIGYLKGGIKKGEDNINNIKNEDKK